MVALAGGVDAIVNPVSYKQSAPSADTSILPVSNFRSAITGGIDWLAFYAQLRTGCTQETPQPADAINLLIRTHANFTLTSHHKQQTLAA